MSCLQEISTNVDTLALAGRHGDPPIRKDYGELPSGFDSAEHLFDTSDNGWRECARVALARAP